jgi:hypothetical protein
MWRFPHLVLACLALGCAPRALLVDHPVDPVPLAREQVRPGLSDVVWFRAIHLLTGRGYGLDACDEGRTALRTSRTELDAPCGATTCLARQYVTVKVGWRAVRLSVRREVWDPTYRDWVPLLDPRSVADAVRVERALLAELMAQADLWTAAPIRAAEDSPCPRPAPCQPGQCDLIGLPSEAALPSPRSVAWLAQYGR